MGTAWNSFSVFLKCHNSFSSGFYEKVGFWLNWSQRIVGGKYATDVFGIDFDKQKRETSLFGPWFNRIVRKWMIESCWYVLFLKPLLWLRSCGMCFPLWVPLCFTHAMRANITFTLYFWYSELKTVSDWVVDRKYKKRSLYCACTYRIKKQVVEKIVDYHFSGVKKVG